MCAEAATGDAMHRLVALMVIPWLCLSGCFVLVQGAAETACILFDCQEWENGGNSTSGDTSRSSSGSSSAGDATSSSVTSSSWSGSSITASSSSSSSIASSSSDCGETQSNPRHCGACGHDCGMGACQEGRCQPFTWQEGGTPQYMAVSETGILYWTNHALSGSVMKRSLVDEEDVATTLATFEQEPWSIHLDGDHLLWTAGKSDSGFGASFTIRHIPPGATEAQDLLTGVVDGPVVMMQGWLVRPYGRGYAVRAEWLRGSMAKNYSDIHWPPAVMAGSPQAGGVFIWDLMGELYRLEFNEQGPADDTDSIIYKHHSVPAGLMVASGTRLVWSVGNTLECLPLLGGEVRVLMTDVDTNAATTTSVMADGAFDEQTRDFFYTTRATLDPQSSAVIRIKVDDQCSAESPEVLFTAPRVRGLVLHGDFIYWAVKNDGATPPGGAHHGDAETVVGYSPTGCFNHASCMVLSFAGTSLSCCLTHRLSSHMDRQTTLPCAALG